MPGVQAADKQNIQIGNPNLQPEFINLAELNYNKIFGSNNWISTLYLANETNTLKPLTYTSTDDPSVKITKFVNGTNELMYGLDNTLKLSFGKNLELMLNANVFNFTVNVDTFSSTGWTWTSKANLTYKFPANISMQINGGYDADRPAPQGTRKGVAFADFAVKKSFFNNAANVTFSINDMFNSRKDISILDQPSYYQETMRRRDTRFYKISLQIPFGKADASMFKKMKDAKKQGGQQEQPDFGG
jgi:outer membrane cobalamin receptor